VFLLLDRAVATLFTVQHLDEKNEILNNAARMRGRSGEVLS
jgi:hypothetical protein